jgi:hypothetical protein
MNPGASAPVAVLNPARTTEEELAVSLTAPEAEFLPPLVSPNFDQIWGIIRFPIASLLKATKNVDRSNFLLPKDTDPKSDLDESAGGGVAEDVLTAGTARLATTAAAASFGFFAKGALALC